MFKQKFKMLGKSEENKDFEIIAEQTATSIIGGCPELGVCGFYVGQCPNLVQCTRYTEPIGGN